VYHNCTLYTVIYFQFYELHNLSLDCAHAWDFLAGRRWGANCSVLLQTTVYPCYTVCVLFPLLGVLSEVKKDHLMWIPNPSVCLSPTMSGWTVGRIVMKFGIGVIYRNLCGKCEFDECWLRNSHTSLKGVNEILLFLYICRRVCRNAKSDYWLRHIRPSLRLSVRMEQIRLIPDGFSWSLIFEIFSEKLSSKWKFY
jgi:hypothetical protein